VEVQINRHALAESSEVEDGETPQFNLLLAVLRRETFTDAYKEKVQNCSMQQSL
jgi:hypothetical protein